MLNENIALAKSILNKAGIDESSDDYKDYLKIREIVGNNNGFVGILVRLRFIDDITDMDEIQSIFDVLKSSRMDMAKLSKMSYQEILDEFYDKLVLSKNNDFELIFKDNEYSYFRVYTYKGILEIGSPAWCLKTKSNWDKYQTHYPNQWVIIDNKYVNKLMTPNNYYLGGQYVNETKTWVRYGVSTNVGPNKISWLAHNDNDGKCDFTPSSTTFFGILSTVLNLESGFKKSYYDYFRGCKSLGGGRFLVEDSEKANDWLPMSKMEDGDKFYLSLSDSYSFTPVMLYLYSNSYPIFRIYREYKDMYCIRITEDSKTYTFLKDYVNHKVNLSYIGIKIKLGLLKIEDALKLKSFKFKVGKWLVYDWNDNFYMVVDSEIDQIILPLTFRDKSGWRTYWASKEGKSSIFYLIDKREKKTYMSTEYEIHKGILDSDENKEILNKLFPKTSIFKKFW